MKYGKCQGTVLNSGTYIGYTEKILDMIKESHKYSKDEKSDQRILMKLCKDKKNNFFRENIAIDFNNIIFYVPH